MMNNTNKRSTCVVCNCNLLEDIVIIGDQYPSAIYPKTGSNYKSLIKPSSLNLTKCSSSDCGLVQLANKYDLDFVLKNYPYLT